MNYDKLDRLQQTIDKFQSYHKDTIPLCAAENVISEFVKLPLYGDIQERYIMNNYGSFDINNNFIGSEYLLPFYSYIQDECASLFDVKYSDARTLSGMNCLVTLLMSLTKAGDKIIILPDKWGGHPSVKPVCERLGLEVFSAPYSLEQFDLKYDILNEIIEKEKIKFVLLAPSDLIKPLSVEKLRLGNSILLYDVSQIMGLIAMGVINNPLKLSENTVIFGGTHKTLPGPASGLILTNNQEIHIQLENNINPKFLRHTQMHQVASLLFTFYELNVYGKEYMKKMVENANMLGYLLAEKGFEIGKINGKYSFTHQIFILSDKKDMEKIFNNALHYGVTLNKKEKALFNGFGIRLGVQEITRYDWNNKALDTISLIMNELIKDKPNDHLIQKLKKSLPEKKISYTYPEDILTKFKNSLHRKF